MTVTFELKVEVKKEEVDYFISQYNPDNNISTRKIEEIIALQTLQMILLKQDLTCKDFTIKDGK